MPSPRVLDSTSLARVLRAALLLALALGFLLGARESPAEPAKRPWRLTAAPAEFSEILALAQPPTGEQTDQPDSEREIPLPKGGLNNPTTPTTPTTETKQPTFSLPDTMTHGNPAALETLGPPTANRNLPAGNAAPQPAAAHHRRGLLGIHPIALLVGLVALHIFVVTTVVK